MRKPNPERGYLWTFKKIIHEHLWLIDEHLWRKKQRHLCRKGQKTFMTKNKYFWPKTYSFMTFPNAKYSRMPDERNLCPFIWHFQSLLFFVFNIVGGSADTFNGKDVSLFYNPITLIFCRPHAELHHIAILFYNHQIILAILLFAARNEYAVVY